MNKIEIIKKFVDEFININTIKSIFSVNSIFDNNDCMIDLYLLVNEEDTKDVMTFVGNIMNNYNSLIYNKNLKFQNYNKSCYYYDNSLMINIYYLNDLNVKIYSELYKFYDPYNILTSFKISKLPFTNIEYAKKIDEFSSLLFDLYRSVLSDDKFLSYNIALKIQSNFILIYRGFYDSLNAKREFFAINKTMDEKYYLNLINKIKYFRYDNFFDYVREYIKEVNEIIDKLPINVISLFNIDFYTYTKKLIYEL